MASTKIVFSNSVLKASLKRLESHQESFQKFFADNEINYDFVKDENRWHSADFANKYWKRFADLEGESSLEKTSEELYDHLEMRAFASIAKLVFSAERFFERLPSWSIQVNHFNRYSFRLINRRYQTNTGEIIQDYNFNEPEYKDLCRYMCHCSRGSIKGSLKALGYKLTSLVETECIDKGDSRCVYRFTWLNKPEYASYLISTIIGLFTFLGTQKLANSPTLMALNSIIALLCSLLSLATILALKLRRRLSDALDFQDSSFAEYTTLLQKYETLNTTMAEYQQEFQSTFKLAQLGELSYGLIHDMATPIMSIGFNSKRLEASLSNIENKSAELSKMINSINGATKKLTSFQQNMRKLISGNQEKLLTMVNISDIIVEVTNLIKYLEIIGKIQLNIVIDTNIGLVEVYESNLERIFMNLLTNSYKYLKDRPERKVDVIVSPDLDKAFYQIEIRDTGPGIPPETLKHLTKRFVQSQKSDSIEIRGSGFGVYAVNKLAKEMNGTMEIASEVNVGTSIKLRFPVRMTTEQNIPSLVQNQ